MILLKLGLFKFLYDKLHLKFIKLRLRILKYLYMYIFDDLIYIYILNVQR